MTLLSLLFLNLTDSIMYMIAASPLAMLILSWGLKILLRRKETVAYGFNGSRWIKWVFLMWVCMVVINEWALPALEKANIINELKFLRHIGGNDGGNFVIHAFSLFTFVCYFFISFRELNEEQAARARSAKGLVVDLAASAGTATVAAASGITGLLSWIWSFIMAAAYPIISVTKATITYAVSSAGMFFAALIPLIFIGVLLAVFANFLLLILFLATGWVMVVCCAIRFLLNLRITLMGPSRVPYKSVLDD